MFAYALQTSESEDSDDEEFGKAKRRPAKKQSKPATRKSSRTRAKKVNESGTWIQYNKINTNYIVFSFFFPVIFIAILLTLFFFGVI